ncbi:MAG: tetratricopeptide repeat protein [Steroidobacteraceae bacterium]
MMYPNAVGLHFTAANDTAVAAFDETVLAYAGFRRDIGACLKTTLAADPDMLMAHLLKGLFFQFMAIPAILPRAVVALAAARTLAADHGADDRERLHMAGLDAWIRGELGTAAQAYESILAEHPRDLLALKLANFFHFYRGDSRKLRDSVARVLEHWRPQDPGYGFVLSLYAFGQEENGEYRDAERLGRQAIDLNPADAWGVHAVAHVYEMQARPAEGIEWLRGLEPHWNALNNFRYHLWWHRALQHLHGGEHATVLRLYDEQLWDPKSDEYLDLTNDISLLQRLELAGVDVGDRWQAVADKVQALNGVRYFAFIDAHYVLALAAAGRIEQAGAMLAALREHAAAAPVQTVSLVTASVNGDLCEGLLRFRQGDYSDAARLLAPVRERVQLLGGSHAQRKLFDAIAMAATAAARATT